MRSDNDIIYVQNPFGFFDLGHVMYFPKSNSPTRVMRTKKSLTCIECCLTCLTNCTELLGPLEKALINFCAADGGFKFIYYFFNYLSIHFGKHGEGRQNKNIDDRDFTF